MYLRIFSIAFSLTLLSALLSSCDRKDNKSQREDSNSQAKSYLDDMAAKEESNIKKGWAHVEGDGYYYEKPTGWSESIDIQKGEYFLLTSPKDDVEILLVSRYIESIPEGVRDLNDWVQLQYSSMGMPDAVKETREIAVKNGDALEAIITIRDSHLRSRYFSDIFQNPENQRMWLLIVESQERSRLDSPEVRRFLETFRVENFRWLDSDYP